MYRLDREQFFATCRYKRMMKEIDDRREKRQAQADARRNLDSMSMDLLATALGQIDQALGQIPQALGQIDQAPPLMPAAPAVPAGIDALVDAIDLGDQGASEYKIDPQVAANFQAMAALASQSQNAVDLVTPDQFLDTIKKHTNGTGRANGTPTVIAFFDDQNVGGKSIKMTQLAGHMMAMSASPHTGTHGTIVGCGIAGDPESLKHHNWDDSRVVKLATQVGAQNVIDAALINCGHHVLGNYESTYHYKFDSSTLPAPYETWNGDMCLVLGTGDGNNENGANFSFPSLVRTAISQRWKVIIYARSHSCHRNMIRLAESFPEFCVLVFITSRHRTDNKTFRGTCTRCRQRICELKVTNTYTQYTGPGSIVHTTGKRPRVCRCAHNRL